MPDWAWDQLLHCLRQRLRAPRKTGLQKQPRQVITIHTTSPPARRFSNPPESNLFPSAADAVVSFCARLYMKTISLTLVISPLFTILKPSEGKNHEDRNPIYGLA